MLVGFNFQNFTSFYRENTFSMQASNDKKFSQLNTIETSHGELLKSTFILGANGSGKTNFIEAIAYMKSIITSDITRQDKLIANIPLFLLATDSANTPVRFEAEFIIDNILYNYGFSLLNSEVQEEYLSKKDKKRVSLFHRTSPDYQDISINKDMENIANLIKNTRRDSLFLYWANAGNNKIAMSIYKWFENLQIFDAHLSNHLLTTTVEYVAHTVNAKEKVLELLQKADIHISDFKLEPTLSDKSQNAKLLLEHAVYNEHGKKQNTITVPMSFESLGTRKLFEIAGPIIKALKEGSVVFIDEIDSRLHPMLVKHLIMMFNSIDKIRIMLNLFVILMMSYFLMKKYVKTKSILLKKMNTV